MPATFLTLPPEIRNKIYYLVLRAPPRYHFPDDRYHTAEQRCRWPLDRWRYGEDRSQPIPALIPHRFTRYVFQGLHPGPRIGSTPKPRLLRTCRQIHTEALEIFYSIQSRGFHCILPFASEERAHDIHTPILPTVQAAAFITSLSIEMGLGCYQMYDLRPGHYIRNLLAAFLGNDAPNKRLIIYLHEYRTYDVMRLDRNPPTGAVATQLIVGMLEHNGDFYRARDLQCLEIRFMSRDAGGRYDDWDRRRDGFSKYADELGLSLRSNLEPVLGAMTMSDCVHGEVSHGRPHLEGKSCTFVSWCKICDQKM